MHLHTSFSMKNYCPNRSLHWAISHFSYRWCLTCQFLLI